MKTDSISEIDFSYGDDFSLLLKSDPSYLCEMVSKSHLFEEEEYVIRACSVLKKLNKKIVLISDDVDLVKEVKPDCVRLSNCFDNIEGTVDDTIEYCIDSNIKVIYEYHKIMDNPLVVIPYFYKLYPELYGEVFSEEFDPDYLLQSLHLSIPNLYFRGLPLCFKDSFPIKITKEIEKIKYREGRVIYSDINFYTRFLRNSKCKHCKNLKECYGTYKNLKSLLTKNNSFDGKTYDNIYEGL